MSNGTETRALEALPARQAQEAIAISSPLPIDVHLPIDVLDVLPCAVYVCDSEGRVVRCNQRAVELWGRAPKLGSMDERFCGSWRLYRMNGGPLPHNQCPIAEVLRHGRPVRDQEVVIERPDGSRITALANIVALRDASGTITGAVNCFLDITERKRMEEALRERDRQSRDLLDVLPAAIYTTDAAGQITFYNQAAVEFSGRRPEIGSDEWCVSWRMYSPNGAPLPHEECPMAIALKEGRPIRGAEAVAERPDGTRVPFIPYPTPLRDASGALVGAVNMLVDITERKQDEAKTKLLVREVNHRANNLLTLLNAMMRQTRAETVPELVTAMEGRIGALARVQSRLARSQWNGTDLLTLIREELAPFDQRDAPRIQIAGPPVPLAAGDAQALAIVIHELAVNAAKYGALSASSGNVAINWSLMQDGQLVLTWSEGGGPIVSRPDRQGFGTRAISILADQLDGTIEIDWRREGLACRLSIPAKLHGERAAIP